MLRIARSIRAMRRGVLFAQVVAAWTVVNSTSPALAQNEPVWPVDHRLEGRLNEDGEPEKSEDVSGIACSPASGFPRKCVVIDDNTQFAQVVIVNDGRLLAGDKIPLISDTFNGEPLELDGEGVAFTDGYFYVIGSHGHPRDKGHKLDPVKQADRIAASIRASSRVVRIQLDPAKISTEGKLSVQPKVELSSALRPLLLADPLLQPFVDQRLDENGLTIEGIAVRGPRLYVGMRGPSMSDGHAVIFSVATEGLFGGGAAEPKLHLLRLGEGRGVRDLTVSGDSFLVLAGPTADPESGGNYSVYEWDGEERVRLLKDLPTYATKKKQDKPEAILPLDQSANAQRVLILFDGAKEGSPRAMEIRK